MDKGKIYSLCITVLFGMAYSAYGMEDFGGYKTESAGDLHNASNVSLKEIFKTVYPEINQKGLDRSLVYFSKLVSQAEENFKEKRKRYEEGGKERIILDVLYGAFDVQDDTYSAPVDEIKQFLQKGANFTSNKNASGYLKRGQRLLLFYAVHHDELQLAKALLATGISGNVIQGKDQLSLLHVAGTSSVKMVKLLLKHGAKVNVRDVGASEAPSCKPLDSINLDYCFSEKPKEVARIMKLLRKKRATCYDRCSQEVDAAIEKYCKK